MYIIKTILFIFAFVFIYYLAAPEVNAQQVAYAWADKPSTQSYTPSGSYSFNYSGSINIKRNGTGKYIVTFAGFGSNSRGGNVQVTAYGSSRNTCNVVSWNHNSNGADFLINISCYTLNGQPADMMYTVLVTK